MKPFPLIAAALGPYTYAVVGAMALLETAAGTGLVAPGEAAVVIGGVTAARDIPICSC